MSPADFGWRASALTDAISKSKHYKKRSHLLDKMHKRNFRKVFAFCVVWPKIGYCRLLDKCVICSSLYKNILYAAIPSGNWYQFWKGIFKEESLCDQGKHSVYTPIQSSALSNKIINRMTKPTSPSLSQRWAVEKFPDPIIFFWFFPTSIESNNAKPSQPFSDLSTFQSIFQIIFANNDKSVWAIGTKGVPAKKWKKTSENCICDRNVSAKKSWS